MESVHHVNVPLRAGKKMKKRKELDALVVSGKRVKRGSQDQLLSETTDEEQDSSSHWSAKDRRCRVFVRRRVFVSLLRACTAALVFACVVATTTVLWLFIDIREQVTSLRNELDQVVAGSQAFPDALQKCHSLSRDLQQNQTLLFNNFAMLSHQLQNLSNQLIGMQAGLQSVEERLKAAPELVNLPQDMQSLSTSVASFGSQIRDLNTTVTGLKNDNGQLQELAKIFRENVTTLKDKVVQLVNVTQQLQTPSTENTAEKEALWPVITQLTANMTQLNDTFNNKLQWVQNDQSKDHKLIVGLQDSSQNMSARLTTLEGECVKSAVHSALNETVDKLIHQITDSTSRLNEVSRQVKELQVETQQLENSASQFAAQPGDIESIVGPTGVPQQTQGTEDSSNQSISPKPI